MSRPSKTGGGPGTNQYQVRGQAKAAERPVHSYPPDRVVRRGDCVWLRAGFDDIWCLKHRKPAPELRQLVGLQPCVTKLDVALQRQLAEIVPSSQLGPWIDQISDDDARSMLLQRVPPDQLGWAARATHLDVRAWAAMHMPPDQLAWATRDEDWEVRLAAAHRMPPDQLQWATKDEDWEVRVAAAHRMPPDQLQWATTDEDWHVRWEAAERVPEDQLDWAITDPDEDVRAIARRRTRARWIGPQ